jgi:hypothetical protein
MEAQNSAERRYFLVPEDISKQTSSRMTKPVAASEKRRTPPANPKKKRTKPVLIPSTAQLERDSKLQNEAALEFYFLLYLDHIAPDRPRS